MSTSPNLKKILRERTGNETALSGLLFASFRRVSREALFELVVAYYNGVDLEAFTSKKEVRKRGKAFGEESATAIEGRMPTATANEFGIDHMYFSGMERLAFLLLEATGDLFLDPETREPTDQQRRVIRHAAAELRSGRSMFRAAVKWLCSPKSPKPVGSPNRRTKLLESGKLEWGRYPDIDQRTENFINYFETHGLRHFRIRPSLQHGILILSPRCIHFVDLLCAFLLSECSGRPASEMPIKTCPQCKTLFWSPSSVAEFCSRICQWKHYWTPERKRDDTYLKRLELFVDNCRQRKHGFSQRDLGAKLKSRQVMTRVSHIEQRWLREWPKLAMRARAIRSANVKDEIVGHAVQD